MSFCFCKNEPLSFHNSTVLSAEKFISVSIKTILSVSEVLRCGSAWTATMPPTSSVRPQRFRIDVPSVANRLVSSRRAPRVRLYGSATIYDPIFNRRSIYHSRYCALRLHPCGTRGWFCLVRLPGAGPLVVPGCRATRLYQYARRRSGAGYNALMR